ncbi:MAG: prolipoprotein diacylglyceryl transferase family protein [Desulfopila sp.]
MHDIFFLTGFGLLLMALLAWAFKHLPGERWQMLAVVPLRKNEANVWHGTNLTYYGFFIATSQLLSFALLLILLQAIHVTISGAILATLVVLAFCLPAARLVAIIVEKKRHTFTIGGASFVGVIIAPWAIFATSRVMASYTETHMPMIPLLAALSIAYTLGEGLGRLGCISYGCCYGKPIQDSGRLLRFVFAKINFIFDGDNKKVSYEAQLNGKKLIPIQAITCVLYTCGALVGAWLFLQGSFTEALLLTMMLTQLWRIFSETLRADFRGFSKISTYQKMGVISVLYIVGISFAVPVPQIEEPSITQGIKILWNPGVIIGLQLLWAIFFYTFGRSTVTSSQVSFALIRENI